MVKTEWLTYYDPVRVLPRFTSKLQSWDTANKSGELNDYSVCTTWGAQSGRYYLLDVFRQRLDYPELKRAVVSQIAKHNPNTVLIEDKASGTQLIQELRSQGQYRIKPYAPPPQTDKIMRLHSQTAKFESGNILLPVRLSGCRIICASSQRFLAQNTMIKSTPLLKHSTTCIRTIL